MIVASEDNAGASRSGIVIAKKSSGNFDRRLGFAILVASPIAIGVGKSFYDVNASH